MHLGPLGRSTAKRALMRDSSAPACPARARMTTTQERSRSEIQTSRSTNDVNEQRANPLEDCNWNVMSASQPQPARVQEGWHSHLRDRTGCAHRIVDADPLSSARPPVFQERQAYAAKRRREHRGSD